MCQWQHVCDWQTATVVASVSESFAVDERQELWTESGGSDGGVLCVDAGVCAIGRRRRLHELRELAPAVLTVALVTVSVAVDECRELRTDRGGSDGGVLCVGDGGAPA